MPIGKPGINKHAVVGLALFGPQDRVEMLFRETRRTVKRLKLSLRDATPLTQPPGEGSSPCVHDVMRWLDALEPGDGDLKFLTRLHVTARARVRPEVRKEKT